MMNRMRLLILLAVLTATLPVLAYPTMLGDTGLVQIPTANVQREATFALGADYLPAKTPAGNTLSLPIRLCYGLSEGSEFSVLISNVGDNTVGVNVEGAGAKIVLIDEELYGKLPGVAAGIRAFRQKTAPRLNAVEGYLVASKVLLARGDNIEEGFTVRIHGGLTYTSYSGAVDADFTKPFIGLSYLHVNSNALVLDYLPEQQVGGVTLRQATVSAALRRRLSDHFWMQVGTTRAFGGNTADTPFAGIIYRYAETNTRADRRPIEY
ncbi:MAG TPA: hypothetical protein PLZ36_05690 [Armatimonadota bacterium]|nr:hypothetical protein [Armatimonadota bacterium]HOS42724.1 hypothetical protein [Armatimonadota bacterium]